MSFKRERWLPECFKKSFHFRKLCFGQVDFSFDYPTVNFCRDPKTFWSTNCKKFSNFFRYFLLQKILWTRRIQIWQAQRKFFCQESVFLVRSPELISKRGFFWTFCLKKTYGYVPESALLTTMRNIARQNSGNFLIEVGEGLKSYLFLSNVFLKIFCWICRKHFC